MAKQLNVNLAFTADTSKAAQQLQELQRQLTNLTTTNVAKTKQLGITKEIQEATLAATQLKVQLESATNSTTGQLDLSKFNQSLQQSGMSLEKYRKQLTTLGPSGQQAFASLARSVMDAEVSLKRTNGLLIEMWTTLKNTARWQLSSSIIHGFQGAVQQAYGYAKDLNESLNNIRIVTGANTEQMARFAEEANKAAKALSTTTTNYTNASLIYYQQGLTDQEVKERTDVTIKMANVSRSSAEIVSDQMTAVWNNFDDGSKSLEYYADVMTALGAATASSTDEISEGLNKFAAVAETVGLSYEYAAASLATVTATTRQSADVVGNAFKTLFARIQGLQLGETLDDGTTLNKYSQALMNVGINIKDTNGEIKGMDILLDELGNKWNTLGKDQQIALSQTVAGVRQYTQLIALMDNWDYFQENLGVAYNSEGELQKQADIYAESWEAARDRAKAAAEDVYDSLIDEKFFITLTDGFGDFLSLIADTVDALGGMKGVVLLLGSVLMKAFGPDLASNINNFISRLTFGVDQATKLKQEAANQLVQTQVKNGVPFGTVETQSGSGASAIPTSDYGASSIAAAYQKQGIAQKMVLDNASKLSTIEQTIAQNILDQVAASGALVQQKEKALKAAQRQSQETANKVLRQIDKSEDKGVVQQARNKAQEAINKNTQINKGKIIAEGAQELKNGEALLQTYKELQTVLAGLDLDIDLTEEITDANELKTKIETIKNTLDGLSNDSGTEESNAVRDYEILAEAGGATGSSVEQDIDAMFAAANAEEDLTRANLGATASLDNMGDHLNNIKGDIYGFGDGISALGTTLMGLSTAISAIQGLGSIWANEDMTTGEKILSTITTLAMVIPSLTMALNAQNLAKLKGLAIDKETIKSTLLNIITTKGVAVANEEATIATLALKAAQSLLNVKTLIIIAAFTALVGITAAIIKKYNEDAIAAKKAAKAHEELAEAASDVASEADSIRSAFEGYDSAVEALKECTRGTEEWYNALKAVNNEVLSILQNHPELAGQIQTSRDENGMLQIDNRDEILNLIEDKERKAQAASIMSGVTAQEASIQADKTAFKRANGYVDTYDSNTGESFLLGTAADVLLDHAEELVDLTNEEYVSAIQRILGEEGLAGYANYFLDQQDELEKIGESEIELSNSLENAADAIAEQYAIDNKIDNETQTELISEAYEKAYDTIYDEIIEQGTKGINAWSGKNDDEVEALWQRYSEATGTNYELDKNAVVGTDNNREFKYQTDEGDATISLETMAAAIAAAEALDGLGVAAETAANFLQGLGAEEVESVNNFLNNFNSATGEFNLKNLFGTLTVDQLESLEGAGTLKDIASVFGLTEEQLSNLLTQIGADITSFINQITGAADIIDATQNVSVADSVFGMNTTGLSMNQRQDLHTDFGIINEQLRVGGVNNRYDLERDINAANIGNEEGLADFWAGVADIDLASEDAGEKISALADELGISGIEGFLEAIASIPKVLNVSTAEINTQAAELKEIIGEGLESGDILDAEAIAKLEEAGINTSDYFDQMYDGTFKLTGAVEEFNNAVKNITLDQLKAQLSDYQTARDSVEYENDYTKANLTNTDVIGYKNLASDRLEYIQGLEGDFDFSGIESFKMGDGSTMGIDELLGMTPEEISNLQWTEEALQAVTDAIGVVNEAEANTKGQLISGVGSIEELNALLIDGTISAEDYNEALSMIQELEGQKNGLSNEEIQERAEAIQDIAVSSEAFADTLEDDKEAAEEVAREILRYQRAIDKVSDSYEAWEDAIDKGTLQDQPELFGEIKEAYGDLLDLDGDKLSDSFLTSAENLDLMKEAAEGNADAYDQLQSIAAQNIFGSIGEVTDEIANAITEIANIDSVDVGEKIIVGENDVANKLNDLYMNAYNAAIAGGYSVAEAMARANDVINAVGYNPPELEMEAKEITVTTQLPNGVVPYEGMSVEGPNGETIQGYNWEPTDSGTYTYTATIMVPKKATSFTKSAETVGGGGKKSSGGGGGGGGGSKKDKKKYKDEIERYHEITEKIEDITAEMEALADAKDRAFGADKLEILDQEIAKTEELIDAQKQYISEIEGNLTGDKAALAAYGAEFDASGRIINYDELMKQQIDKFNTSRTEEAEEAYNEFIEILELYEETLNLFEEESNNLINLNNELSDKNLEKIEIKVNYKTESAEDFLEQIDFLLEGIEDDAYKTAKAIGLLGEQTKYTLQQMEAAETGLQDLLANKNLTDEVIKKIMSGAATDAELKALSFTEDEISDIRDWSDALRDGASTLRDIRKEVEERILDAFDQWNEEMEDSIELFEYYNDLMESFKNIIDIVGKDMLGISDAVMESLDTAIVDNAVNKLTVAQDRLDILNKRQIEAEEARAHALAEGDTAAVEMWDNVLKQIAEDTREATEELMSNWEEALEVAADAFEQTIERVVASFEKAMSGTFGSFDALQSVFDQQGEISERYLADYQKIYELTKLNRNIQNSMDDTDNIKAKRALRDLQVEINELQESDTQMSQYDLDYLQKKYELKLAEIALEEAQNAKSQVRMTRDSEGNWSYTYTADQDKIDEAYQNYEDKLYEMQELNNEYIKETQNNILKSEIELANALRELDKAKFKTDAEYYAEVARITDYYTGQQNYYIDEANKSLNRNKDLYTGDWQDYSDATGYKISANEDYIDSFDETILSQITGYSTLEEVQNAFAENTQIMVNDMRAAFVKWQNDVERVMNAVDTTTAQFGDAMIQSIYGDGENPGIVDASNDAVEAFGTLTEDMTTGFDDIAKSATSFADTYSSAIDAAISKTEDLASAFNEVIRVASGLDENGQEIQEETSETSEETITEDVPAVEAAVAAVSYPYGKASNTSGNITSGWSGRNVQAIQYALNKLGYGNSGTKNLDGIFGSGTWQAVYAFQKAMGIQKDGVVGSETRRAFASKGYKTGGLADYTGLAWLDGTPTKPELVLNPTDTQNLLKTVELVDSLSKIIDLNVATQAAGLGMLNAISTTNTSSVLEQEVTIHAEFPNATDHNEIEMAFESLVNRASQFANRKNK